MKTSNTKSAASAHSLVSLVKGTLVEGTVEAESDIRVDGTIKGKLVCHAKVILGPNGLIEGEIYCENAVIEGTLIGQIQVNDLLNVRETANVEGRVQTEKLIVESGAVFNVKCHMGNTPDETEAEELEEEELQLADPDIQPLGKADQTSA